MGDAYTPLFSDMKRLRMPSRRDMNFLHSHSNESYMHSNVMDLENYVREMVMASTRDGGISQTTEEESQSTGHVDHEQPNWKIVVGEQQSTTSVAEKDWELICAGGINEWEMV
jgi:hypothetical protein